MQTPLNQYDLIGQIAGSSKKLQTFVDNVVANRYNRPQWKDFYSWAPMTMSRSFSVMEAEVDLFPMASVIDTNAPKPKRALQGFSLYDGKIPKLGHSYDLTEDDLVEYYNIIEAGGVVSTQAILELLFNTVNKLEFGAHSRINSMGFAAMSTGHIVLDTTNNPDGGVIIDLDMRIPTANKKYAGFANGVSAAWTDPTATPTQDIIDVMNYCDDNNIPYNEMKMTKAKFRQYATHDNTVTLVNARKGIADSIGAPVTESDVKQFMSDMGFPEVRIVDEKSGLQTDGITSNVESFDTNNIVFSISGTLGEVKNARPIPNFDPAVREASSEDGRIQILQYFDGRAKTQGFDMECIALPVLNMAKKIVILDTSTAAPWT